MVVSYHPPGMKNRAVLQRQRFAFNEMPGKYGKTEGDQGGKNGDSGYGDSGSQCFDGLLYRVGININAVGIIPEGIVFPDWPGRDIGHEKQEISDAQGIGDQKDLFVGG